MKTPHKYPSLDALKQLVENAPKVSKSKSDKAILEQEELKMPPNKLGYDNFDGLLISNFAGDIASFRF